MGQSTVENVGSALGRAWREAAGSVNESPPKQSKGPLSGMRGVVVGAGLGVLATKKVVPLVQGAMLKYVASRATDAPEQDSSSEQATEQGSSTDQAAEGSPAQ